MANRFFSSCESFVRSLGRARLTGAIIGQAKRWHHGASIQFKGWLALYLIAAATVAAMVKSILHAQLDALYPDLMPAFHPDFMPLPNLHLIDFVTLIFASLGIMALHWLRDDAPFLFRLPLPHPLVIACLAALGMVALPSFLSFLLLGAALALALCMLLPGSAAIAEEEAPWFGLPRLSRLMMPVLALPILLGVFISYRSWYPLVLPNDYFELEDTVHTRAIEPFATAEAPKTLDRSQVISCLKEQESPELLDWYISNPLLDNPLSDDYPFSKPQDVENAVVCPLNHSDALIPGAFALIQRTGAWQSQLGRMLFHHSYVYVPARHLQTYGLIWEVPMLYGIGQTAYYAAMMKLFGHTLANYFNYYFIGIFIGFACISLAAGVIARSWMAGICSAMLSMGCFFAITFEGTFLSAGFNPLRFVGVALQTASIAYLFRRPDIRGMAVSWLAMACAFLWNSEFAIIGATGQLFAVLAPALRLNLRTRLLLLALMVSTLLAAIIFKGVAENALFQNNGFGVFGIGTPSINTKEFADLLGATLAGFIALWAGMRRFSPAARQARLAILPVLALMLIKFVFTASPLHLYTTLSFVLPFTLIYFPYWNSAVSWPGAPDNRRNHSYIALRHLLYLLCAGFFLFHALLYHRESKQYKNTFAQPFVVQQWTGLRDTISSAAPEAPLVARVNAIKQELKPHDAVLMLSPFDHVLSFYTSPERYCGNFEMLSNVVTQQHLAMLADCVLHKPNVLVIYDKALEIPCDSPQNTEFTDPAGCRVKMLAKDTLTLLRDKLLSYMVKVKETGDLTFYRAKPAPAS